MLIHLVMLEANEKELMELSKQDELVKEFDEKMFILNSDNTFTRTISEEEDQKLLINAMIEEAQEEAAEKATKKATNNRNIEIAESMLEETPELGIDKISKVTGVSKGKIMKLQKKLKLIK